ncbi:MAG: hypothetical protein ACTSPI_12615, partial [Candidatus Heimdallarchaeaceae archaeon]
SFARELESGTKEKEIRGLCAKINLVADVLGYNKISEGEISFGERKIGEKTPRELIVELEQKGQEEHVWNILLDLIDVTAMNDTRLKGFLTTIVYSLIDQVKSAKETFNIHDVNHFIKELIAYKNLNRYCSLNNIGQILDYFERDEMQDLTITVDGKTFILEKESLISYVAKNEKENSSFVDIEFLEYIFLSMFFEPKCDIHQAVKVTAPEFFTIVKDYMMEKEFVNSLVFEYQGQHHFVTSYEFLDFLLRVLNGEKFQELEVELRFKSQLQLIEKPIIITIDNVVRYLPPLAERFQDFFEIGYFFMVGNTIEFTHPNVLSKIDNRDLREAVRNYTIYPGLGFVRISVVGKDEAFYIPLNALVLSYGLEALLSETTIAGRIAVEYSSSDKWAPPISREKMTVNKIQIPKLLEIFKQQLGIRKTAYVENESLKRQIGKFATYFREFIAGKNVLKIEDQDSFYIGVPEFPLKLIKADKNNGEKYILQEESLSKLTSIVNLAFHNRAIGSTVETLEETISEELQQIYTISQFRSYDNLTSPFTQLIDDNIVGHFSLNDLIFTLQEYPQLEHALSILEETKNLTPDLTLDISELGINFITRYTLSDLMKRIQENVVIVPQKGCSWQLSHDAKLIFYNDLFKDIRNMLSEKIGEKKLYEILVPI